MNSCKVCITTKSTLASLLFKGLATKNRTVKWSIGRISDLQSSTVHDHTCHVWQSVQGRARGYSRKIQVVVQNMLLETLAILQTKISDFHHSISDLHNIISDPSG